MGLKKDIYGLACFLAIRILVPENLRVLGGTISLNTAVIFIIVFIFLIKINSKNHKVLLTDKDKKYGMVLIGFVIYSLIVLPISSFENLSYQFFSTIQFGITEIVPAVFAIAIIKKKEDVLLIENIYLISTIVCCTYGIISYLLNDNPYIYALTGESISRVMSWKGESTSATFVHENGLGYFLTMSIPMFFLINDSKLVSKKVTKTVILLSFIMVFLCKKRSAFISVAFFLIIWFGFHLTRKKVKNFFSVVIVGAVVLYFVMRLPSFENTINYLKASIIFWDDNIVQGVSSMELGSTFEMRIDQILYPFIEIQNNPFFGHGAKWCAYYLSEHPFHPIMYGFETILSRITCEYGLLGFGIFYYIFYCSYKYSRYVNKNGTNYSLLYILTIIVMAIATGLDYYYLFFLSIILIHKQGVLFNE